MTRGSYCQRVVAEWLNSLKLPYQNWQLKLLFYLLVAVFNDLGHRQQSFTACRVKETGE